MDAVILCGGRGTRLESILPGRQKVTALVGTQHFIVIVLDRLFSEGVGRVVLCVGHLKDQVVEIVSREKSSRPGWGEIIFSEEEEPLGTGGAVKHAESKILGDHFFVMNGDTLAHVPLAELHDFHLSRGSVLTIAAAPIPDRADVGSIDLGNEHRIHGFRERAEKRAGFVNAGTYLMTRQALAEMPLGSFSIEKDFFPQLITTHPCYAFVVPIEVLDIGTPERYQKAQDIFKK